MKIDEWTARNLELRTSTEGSLKHSLLGVMDETRSPMGARASPSLDELSATLTLREIKKRQEAAWRSCSRILSARERT